MIPFANIDPGTSTIAAAVIQAIGAIIAAAITGGLAYVIWRWGRETESVPRDGERVEQLKGEILENSGLELDDGLPGGSITKKRGSFVLLLGPRLVPSRRFVHFSWVSSETNPSERRIISRRRGFPVVEKKAD